MTTLETLGLSEEAYTALILSGVDTIDILQEVIGDDWWNLYARPPYILTKSMCKEIQNILIENTPRK